MLRSADARGDGPDTFIAAPAPGSACRRRCGWAGTPEAVTAVEEPLARGSFGVHAGCSGWGLAAQPLLEEIWGRRSTC